MCAPQTLNREIDRSRPNLPEEDALNLAMQAVSCFVDQILDRHNDVHPDGNCQCDLCYDLAGFRWSLESAASIISSEMKPVSSLSIDSAQVFVDLMTHTQFVDEPIFLEMHLQ